MSTHNELRAIRERACAMSARGMSRSSIATQLNRSRAWVNTTLRNREQFPKMEAHRVLIMLRALKAGATLEATARRMRLRLSDVRLITRTAREFGLFG